ncbi:MAG: asparagine synthase (glutamine-hydrolyzing) [Desulfovibrionaceae bacterium]
MCGICVWVHAQGDGDGERMSRAVDLLHHRGPDNRNCWLWDGDPGHAGVCGPAGSSMVAGRFRVGLAHARLSILDLSDASNQPMLSQDGNDVLVFNGEVYNYIELRDALAAQGERFATTGDSEVLLRLLAARGEDAVREINGMWAFARLDRARRRVTLGRDRYGKKPLFYYHDAEQFIAASECKAIFEILARRRRIHLPFLTGYCVSKTWPYLPEGATLYEGVRSVPPGCVLTLDIGTHQLDIRETAPIEAQLRTAPDMGAFAETVESAIRLRLRSDVPIGVAISGGVDSTAIAAFAARHGAGSELSFYTLRTANDDLDYSRRVAASLGVPLVEVDIDTGYEPLFDAARRLTMHYEYPVNLSHMSYAGYLLFKAMHDNGVRVALDGTGGDEVLGGYPGYYTFALGNLILRKRLAYALGVQRQLNLFRRQGLGRQAKDALKVVAKMVLGRRPSYPIHRNMDVLGRYARHFSVSDLQAMVDACYAVYDMDNVREMQIFELTRGQMHFNLHLNDQNSMVHSVEARSPFLDYRLAPYVGMPERDKFRKGFNKYLLRSIIPAPIGDDVRWRRVKYGFGCDTGAFFRDNEAVVESMIRDSGLVQGLFDVEAFFSGLKQGGAGELPVLRGFIPRLYSLALLESVYDCTL